jgi:hypothetical protein
VLTEMLPTHPKYFSADVSNSDKAVGVAAKLLPHRAHLFARASK